MASKGFEAYLRLHPVSAFLTPWRCGTPQRAVIGVLDGDTISLIDHDHRAFESASLKWMPPEKHQPFDAASKQSLASLVFGQDVLNNVVAIARSRLSLGKILIGEFDINLVMVRRVMAWVCERYAPERNYLGVQIEAQSEGQELWKG